MKKVKSFGIIPFRKYGDTIMLLMVQRQHNIHFCAIIKGAYEEHNINFVLSNITKKEYEILKTMDYGLFLKHFNYGKYFDTEKFKKMFESKKHILEKALKNINIDDLKDETTWSFPKGRSDSRRENNYKTALREFTEETRLWPSVLHPYYHILVKEHVGSDDVKYQEIYYLCQLKDHVDVKPSNFIETPETKKIKLFTMEELKDLFDNHYQKETYKDLFNDIREYILFHMINC